MIQRIVKLTFKTENADEFANFFTEVKEKIEAQQGCHEVRLLRDLNQRNIFFTYSFWDNQEDLNAYRNSALFGTVWPTVKQWFSDKPEAWSVEKL